MKDTVAKEINPNTKVMKHCLVWTNIKSPGSDGLTVEYNKTFWKDKKNTHLSMASLQKQGLISLIPKQGKQLEILSNWPPISLLNTDSKIATKAISNRIKKVLPSIIHPSQKGFYQR